MATTLGHALCGVSCLMVVVALRKSSMPRFTSPYIFGFSVLANLPDIDYIAGFILASDPNRYHYGATHSLIFPIVSGLIACAFFLKSIILFDRWIILSATIFSHILIDFLTGPIQGGYPSYGLQLLWPLSTMRNAAPVTIFQGPHHQTMNDLFSAFNLWVVVKEVLIFTPLMALLWIVVLAMSRRQ